MDKKIEDIFSRMSLANDILRECHHDLLMACQENGGDGITYDGDFIPRERIEGWFTTLEDIDKVCYYV